MEFNSQRVAKLLHYSVYVYTRLPRRGLIFFFPPGHTVHGILVDWRHHEADRRHQRLVSRVVQDLPLERLRVVEERTLVSFMDGDLKHDPRFDKYTH